MDKFTEGNKMVVEENSKDLISVLWNGVDIFRSKMDANEYKDYHCKTKYEVLM